MLFEYGIKNKKINVTNIVIKKCLKNDIISIPKTHLEREKLFEINSNPNIIKNVYINNKEYKCNESIKIQLPAKINIYINSFEIKSGYKFQYFNILKQGLNNLNRFNIHLCNNIAISDIIVVDIIEYKLLYNKMLDKKFIIVMTCDSSSCLNNNILKNENIIYIFKPHILNQSIINKDTFFLKSRYSMYLLNEKYKLLDKKNYKLSNEYLYSKKIKCIIPHFNRFKQYYKQNNKNIFLRKYDVCFLGTINYNKTNKDNISNNCDLLISKNRKDCINAINKLKCSKITNTSKLKFEEYINIIKETKYFISPYGFGEWSHKDFEVIMHDCLLIKPECSNFKSYPNIYKDGIHCISCKIDYSDLEDKINYLNKNPQVVKKIISSNHSLINHCLSMYSYSEDIYNILKNEINLIRDNKR